MTTTSLVNATLAAFVLGLGLVACGDNGIVHIDVPANCSPLGGVGCALPWPSSAFLKPDTTSPTGVRLNIPAGAFPANIDGLAFDPTPYNTRTGFSPLAQIMFTVPGGVDATTLVPWQNMAASLLPTSSTVILDATTGERVAHFAEVDANIMAGDFDHQVVYLRPAQRLAGNTTYIVAITNAAKANGGGYLPITPAFASLRDGGTTDNALVEQIRPEYPAIFTALSTAGVDKENLVMAWQFTTSDDDSTIADPIAARDSVLAAMGTHAVNVPYAITLDQSPDSDDASIARRVQFTYDSPKITGPAPQGFLRDASGTPSAMGTITEPGSIIIPACATPQHNARIVLYGHGFFGDLSESQGGYVRAFANATCSVVIGGLWRGMSGDEIPDAVLTVIDMNRARGFSEGVWQGITDFMVLAQLTKYKLANEVLVDHPGDDNAQSIVDPNQIVYYGISQGGILGATMFGYDPTMTRGVIHVAGANWAMMFERSTEWVQFGEPFKDAYGGELNEVIMQGILSMAFDIMDGGTIANHDFTQGGISGAPPKQYLQHMSAGDSLVTNLASLYLARTFGWTNLTPSVQAPFAMTSGPGPLSSGFAIYDEHPTPLPPTTNLLNPTDNGAHEDIRSRTAVVQQIEHFYDTGDIVNFCTGDCNCQAGDCGPNI